MKPACLAQLYFFVFILISAPALAQWKQTRGPEGGNLQDLVLYNNTLWAAANGLFYSSDEGAHWNFHPAVNKDYTVIDLHVHHDALFALETV